MIDILYLIFNLSGGIKSDTASPETTADSPETPVPGSPVSTVPALPGPPPCANCKQKQDAGKFLGDYVKVITNLCREPRPADNLRKYKNIAILKVKI